MLHDSSSSHVIVASQPRTAGSSWRRLFPSPLVAAILAGMAGGFTSSAFIGRAVEVGRLDAALDRAEQGRPQVELDRAKSAIRRGLAAADAIERFDQVLEGAWVCMSAQRQR